MRGESMTIGEQIKTVRMRLHMSQTDFGKLLKVNFTTVNRWENGKTQPSYKAMREFLLVCAQNNIKIEELEGEVR